MELRSLSASSATTFEACPAQFKAEHVDRGVSISGAAANLGSACHEAMRRWVQEGYYQDPAMVGMVGTAAMLKLFDEEYVKLFSTNYRQQEGRGLIMKWLERQDWTGRKVLSTEVKGEIMLPAVRDGVQVIIPFRFIRDRVDELDDGTIEVVDYKTVMWPVQPEDLPGLVQARAYAMVTRKEHPNAKRIRVKFDLLRYDSVGYVFSSQEMDEAEEYLLTLAQRIIDNPGTEETPHMWCRSCVRRESCETLQKTVASLGSLNPLTGDPVEALHEYVKMHAAQGYMKARMEELEEILKNQVKNSDTGSFEVDGYRATLETRKRRSVDDDALREALTPDMFHRLGSIGLTDLDNLLKSNLLTAEERSLVAQAIHSGRTRPSLKINKA